MIKSDTKISCIILAGGEGKRVGGVDKGLLEYKNRPLIEYIINTIRPQVDDIVISANRNHDRYKQYSSKVVSDKSEKYLGPMAGIDAALPHCKHDWVLIIACDTPLLAADIIDKFLQTKTDSKLYIAESNNKMQLLLLLHRSLHSSIKRALSENQLRLMRWAKSQQPEIVIFHAVAAFKNFNNSKDFET